jgi:hypothetical protein
MIAYACVLMCIYMHVWSRAWDFTHVEMTTHDLVCLSLSTALRVVEAWHNWQLANRHLFNNRGLSRGAPYGMHAAGATVLISTISGCTPDLGPSWGPLCWPLTKTAMLVLN